MQSVGSSICVMIAFLVGDEQHHANSETSCVTRFNSIYSEILVMFV
jgi:hypothetical protein